MNCGCFVVVLYVLWNLLWVNGFFFLLNLIVIGSLDYDKRFMLNVCKCIIVVGFWVVLILLSLIMFVIDRLRGVNLLGFDEVLLFL